MKFFRRQKDYKRCPRCGNKCLLNQTKCEECDLLFSRLEFASNKEAKKQLKHFDRDYVLYTKDLPNDVSYLKLLLYTLILGIFGGHYYYVGKYVKGLLMSLGFVYTLLCTIFNAYIVEYMETMFLFFPIGVYAMGWMVSLVYVLSKKFKVPVLVKMPSVEDERNWKDDKKKRKEFKNLSNEIKKENEKLKNEKLIEKENSPKDNSENEEKDTIKPLKKKTKNGDKK